MNASGIKTQAFDNRFIRELPGDTEAKNYRRQVHAACYSLVQPTPVPAPRVLAVSAEMCETLGLPLASDDPQFSAVFGGNALLDGMQPFAMCYGGHQFGAWAGQLGDGRAINLGEWINAEGERWVLQLKGLHLAGWDHVYSYSPGPPLCTCHKS